MKRLIVCCDGTWNNPEQEDNGILSPTNVVKIYNSISPYDHDNNIAQLRYYHPGVGGEGGLIKKFAGGAVGAGVSRHICSAYHWLASHYEEGDEIYLYGFSRGAFVVRSLAGFIAKGLLDLTGVNSKASWERVHRAYDKGYRVKNSKQASWAKADYRFFNQGKAVDIQFVGAWDTVGALGVPNDLEILNIFDDKTKWEFHNTVLGKHIKTARHAMALDERRSSFTVTRWDNAAKHKDAKEVWFPGVHSDVGGGYANTDLSDIALRWMIKESESVGLIFRKEAVESLGGNPVGYIHNSYRGLFSKMRSRPRSFGLIAETNKAMFDSSVLKRQAVSPINFPSYHPTQQLKVGEQVTIDVFADTRWNETGLFLEKGQSYLFSATGEWKDSHDTCDWKGTQDDKLTIGDIIRSAGSFLGSFENTYQRLSDNNCTDFLLTKRVENLNWFTLVGAIANDDGKKAVVENDGTACPHQYVELAQYHKIPLEIKNAGYLYCFPNDVWSLYENNSGSVQLTVRRIS
ncbi:DUF2235 domain-containing protein [Neptunomonas sp.]|uniref:DUF2235 domain-containing protein n=2 Tax=Neptunomonas sp. TaxID=1971898 RepID=UPI003561D400